MNYFSPSYLDFFKGLGQNNSKDWFDLNRKEYEEHVKKPFDHFAQDLATNIFNLDHEISTELKKCVFRINRDIRFSKDKTPYKVFRAAAFSKNGKKDADSPGYYIELGYEKSYIAGGAWNPDKENLRKIRQEIYYNLDEFNKLIGDLDFVNTFGELKGDRAKRLDETESDYLKDSPYIANKQFYFLKEFSSNDILKSNFLSQVVEDFKVGFPVNDFLRKAIN
jgi:uncharacterized protein (TIGR02453 family)